MNYSLEKAPLHVPSNTAFEIADLLAMSVLDRSGTPTYRDGEDYIRQAVSEGEVGYGLRNDVGELVTAASIDAIGLSPEITIHHIATAKNERRRGHARALLGFIAHEAAMHPSMPGIKFTLNTERPKIFENMGFRPSSYDPTLGDMAAPINKFLYG